MEVTVVRDGAASAGHAVALGGLFGDAVVWRAVLWWVAPVWGPTVEVPHRGGMDGNCSVPKWRWPGVPSSRGGVQRSGLIITLEFTVFHIIHLLMHLLSKQLH